MRKLPTCFESPIDNIILKTADPATSILHKLKMTPNKITTLSLITGLLSILFLAMGKVWLMAIFYFISYMFDCYDGHYARRYGMCTKGGDLYDHVKDVLIMSLLLMVFLKRNYQKLSRKNLLFIVILFVITFIGTWIHMCAQEVYYGNKNDSPFLNVTSGFIPSKRSAEKIMKFSRFFGCGSTILITIAVIIIVENKN